MFEQQNRRLCIYSLISAVIVILCTCTGVVMNLTTLYDENFDHMGIQTFCMFTVNSNILVAMGMGLVIPYTIDGLQKRFYHLPKCLIVFLLTGTSAVTLTFLVSLFVLSPFKGFKLIFTGSRFFLHALGPITANIAFSAFIVDHEVTKKECLYAMIPVFLYACVYYVLVVVVGEERGGWSDFYGFATYLPVWIPMVLILPVTYGIASLIRFQHNKNFRQIREVEIDDEYTEEYLRDTVTWLAEKNALEDQPGTDIVLPRRFIRYLIANTDGDLSFRDACLIYLDAFLENSSS